jgi:hypothetical protein
MTRSYILTVDGDEVGPTTLDEFVAANPDLDESIVADLRIMRIGSHYTEGGGAAPVWTLTRTA